MAVAVVDGFSDSEDTISETEKLLPAIKPSKQSSKPLSTLSWAFLWTLSIIATSSLTAFLVHRSIPSLENSSVVDRARSLSWYSPVFNDIDLHLDEIQMDGDLWWNSSNIFRQDPSPEVDAAWETLQGGIANRIFVSEEDWIKMGMDPEVGVKFPGDVPLYVAEMNVFHLLHCVNVLRKGAFLDYYWYKRPIDPSYWTHFYHCLDMVRQEIMCLGSLDLAPMVWVDLQDQPFPFFSINRTCRRWEDIVRYRDEFEINEEALNLMVHNMTKPLNSKAIPVPKEAKNLFEGYARWRRLDLNKDFEVVEMGDFGRSSMDVLPPVKPNPKNVHAS